MAGISFSKDPQGIWIVAGWAFRQVLQDVRAAYPEDAEIRSEFIDAEALGFLHLDDLREDVAAKIRRALCCVANGILEGTFRSGLGERFRDSETIDAYADGMRGLIAACESIERVGRDGGPIS
jgi:hypothetical protein